MEEHLKTTQSSRGLRPAVSKAVMDERGELCRTKADCHRRWKTHFQQIRNIESEFDIRVVEVVEQRHVRTESPTSEELEASLNALKSKRLGGKNGLALEVVKRIGVVFDIQE